jgi:DNA invertase Pin-like site-specific DNA recombinase
MSTEKDTKKLRGVFYARKSNDDGTDSVEQQDEWARSAAAKENIELLASCTDQGVRGQDTAKRKDFAAMLRFCQEQYRKELPIDVIVLWHSNRFSRADSVETGWFIQEFRKVGVHRLFSASRAWLHHEIRKGE